MELNKTELGASMPLWPTGGEYDHDEVREMAQALRTTDLYKAFVDRNPAVSGKTSARALCVLVLQDMHAQAGIGLEFDHF